MKRKYISGLVISYLLIHGCISEYIPKNVDEVSNLLVVEGTITDSITTIQLSYSVGISDDFIADTYVYNADVYVECDNGEIYGPGIFQENGIYTIPIPKLDVNNKYRLTISHAGDQYQSEYLAPLITPEIDSISWIKNGPGETVYMCVSTHDPQNQSSYYRWSYKENWEVLANIIATHGHEWQGGVQVIVEYDLISEKNIFYCWGKDHSKILLLGSTDKLAENRISQKRLIEMSPDNDRLSQLYHISVEQVMLRKDAYDYFNNLQKNIESTSGIFASMPTEMRGNIKCLNNPDKVIIGYIEVATTTTKERFIYWDEGLYEPPSSSCLDEITEDETSGYPLFHKGDGPGDPNLYAPATCIDCRTKANATKDRPYFWPNNHF